MGKFDQDFELSAYQQDDIMHEDVADNYYSDPALVLEDPHLYQGNVQERRLW